ncbi:RNA-binding protein [Niastella caeni]|uniref:RNA-binding protein n=1 Tax=Niastella caeni TaxID=2569763 RepID=A0A4S8H8C4_9BACT|nr:RNA-binding protein [Niastella caeni]THU31110.1 RNA-binding protein [Niastella caeni]
MNIKVSNLNRLTTVQHLLNLFVPFGVVQSVKIVKKDITGRSQGTGYVKMDRFSGNSAINGLNYFRFMNFYIEVSEAPM